MQTSQAIGKVGNEDSLEKSLLPMLKFITIKHIEELKIFIIKIIYSNKLAMPVCLVILRNENRKRQMC